MTVNYFEKFNQNREDGNFQTPLVILIGGAIGTGKSTFANQITAKIRHITVVPTGIIRSICQSLLSREDFPELYPHTYELVSKTSDTLDRELTISKFLKQAQIVQKAVEKIVSFSFSESQNYIIEGNHITPEFICSILETFKVIPLFFNVNEIARYKQMISGPTHKRDLSEWQYLQVQVIHDYFVKECQSFGVPLFDCTAFNEAEEYLNYSIGEIFF